MNDNEILIMIEKYGDCWVLRDLDCFPEKLSEMCKHYPYTDLTYRSVMGGDMISFKTELEAVSACIKIYEKVLKKKVPYSLLQKYWKLNDK